jgi:transcriptional regulator with XRE-family HTH domain
MNLQELFIANLKKYRKLRKISQMKLAEECNSAQTYICEIENGKKNPSLLMIDRIATALDIDAINLFKDEPLPEERLKLSHSEKRQIAERLNNAFVKIIDDY